MYVVDDDRLARICIAILDKPEVLAVAERIGADELGCLSCLICFPRSSVVGRFPGRCPVCQADLRQEGYLDGETVVARRALRTDLSIAS